MIVNKSFISVALILFATVSVLGCGSQSCSQSAVDGCKAGVGAVVGAGCAVGSVVAGAACGLTLGFACIFRTAIAGGACGPDYQSFCAKCGVDTTKEILSKLKEQGADIKDIKGTVYRIEKNTEQLNENDKKIIKILEGQGVKLEQIEQHGLQIIETLDKHTEVLKEHGIYLDDIKDTVHQIKEQNVKLDLNDQKILSDIYRNHLSLDTIQQELNEQGGSLEHLKGESKKIKAILETHGVKLGDLKEKVNQLKEQNDKLDENDKEIMMLLSQQGIAIDTLNGQNLQILEELRDQDVQMTNITYTFTGITKKIGQLDKNDKLIYSTLLEANIGLDQINDTVLKLAEDTLKLLQEQEKIMKEIRMLDESVDELSQDMKAEFAQTNALIKYQTFLQNIKEAKRMLKHQVPVKECCFMTFDTTKTQEIKVFTDFVLYNPPGVVGWVNQLLDFMIGTNSPLDGTSMKSMYQTQPRLCKQHRERNFLLESVITGIMLYRMATSLDQKEENLLVIDHWQRKLVKAREAFEQSCGCPWGSKLERIGLLSTLDERLGVYSNEARDEENLFKLSEIEDPGLREKAQLLFKEKIEFKIDPNSLKELDKVWFEELQSFIKLFKEKEKKMEVREMTTAYDGLQTCISSKLNPTVESDICPAGNVTFTGTVLKEVSGINTWQECGSACSKQEGCEYWTHQKYAFESSVAKPSCELMSDRKNKTKLPADQVKLWKVFSGLKTCTITPAKAESLSF